MEVITAAYWRPVYKYVRVKWSISPDDAADFAQHFFIRLLEKDFLDSYDSRKGRLRTFLRTCVDHLFMKQVRDSSRLKRGAGSVHFSLDFEEAERELADLPKSESPEDSFEKEWVRSLFTLAVQRLRASCAAEEKIIRFELFKRYDLEDADPRSSYAELAAEFNIAATDVTNHLAFARKEFRRCVLDQLREMTATENEFRREAQALLGMDVVK